jgi:hypothetical protein
MLLVCGQRLLQQLLQYCIGLMHMNAKHNHWSTRSIVTDKHTIHACRIAQRSLSMCIHSGVTFSYFSNYWSLQQSAHVVQQLTNSNTLHYTTLLYYTTMRLLRLLNCYCGPYVHTTYTRAPCACVQYTDCHCYCYYCATLWFKISAVCETPHDCYVYLTGSSSCSNASPLERHTHATAAKTLRAASPFALCRLRPLLCCGHYCCSVLLCCVSHSSLLCTSLMISCCCAIYRFPPLCTTATVLLQLQPLQPLVLLAYTCYSMSRSVCELCVITMSSMLTVFTQFPSTLQMDH